MVVIYGANRAVRTFGRDSLAAWEFAREIMRKGHDVWVLSKREAHIFELS